MKIENQNFISTGAGRGLGLEISRSLARQGASVILADAVNFIIKNDYFTGRVLELDGGLRL